MGRPQGGDLAGSGPAPSGRLPLDLRVGPDRFLVVGEGIEKKQSDFAAEVAAMTKNAA